MPWYELMNITARYFNPGDYMDPEGVGDIWVRDGYETTNSDDVADPDDPGIAICPAVNYNCWLIESGRSPEQTIMIGMLAYELGNTGSYQELLQDHVPDIHRLFNQLRGSSNEKQIALITVWRCDAGKEPDTHNGPGEYWEEWDIAGYLDINGLDIKLVKYEVP